MGPNKQAHFTEEWDRQPLQQRRYNLQSTQWKISRKFISTIFFSLSL